MKYFICFMVRQCFLSGILFCFNALDVNAQSTADSLTRKFEVYRQQTAAEKIYLHTDRAVYLTGEMLWFKVYQVDGSLHKPLDLSKVVYVEVISAAKEKMVQVKVEMSEGFGSGSLFLPASLNSGFYSLRAYTSLMKNFSAEFYFHKSIKLINPFVRPEMENTITTETLSAQFFPEGGNLVSGLKSNVAFQVTGSSGKGVDCTGAILNGINDTLVIFKPNHFGIGHFFFTPKTGEQYHAVLVTPKQTKSSFNLPPILNAGFVLQLQDIGTQLEVKVNQQSEDAGVSSIRMFVHVRNMISQSETITLQNHSATFLIDKNKLAEGISHITIFDSQLQPVCERLYFKQPTQTLITEIQTESKEFQTRRSVKLNLSVNSPQANLSLAIYKIDSISSPYQNGISEYLWLTSDLKGTIESPEYYFSHNDPQVPEAIDNLMLTHGWRRFVWNDLLKNQQPILYLPEFRDHLIKGIIKTDAGVPASGIQTYMSSPSKLIRVYGSRSNVRGEIYYEVKNFYGSNKIILQTNPNVDSTYHFELEDPFSRQFSSVPLPAFHLSPAIKKQLLSRSIDMQVQNIYQNENIFKTRVPRTDSSSFYGTADETYYLNDYTRFPVMEEVMREYVSGVMVRKQKDRFHLMVLDNVNKTLFQENPLVLLDGVPIFDINKIMALNPLKIQKLEVLDRRYFLDALIFPGIVSYSTFDSDLGGFDLNKKNLSIDYEGLQERREFYAPHYDDQRMLESRIPDNRSLLYWNPSLTINNKGKQQIEFFTSDLYGKFEIVIEGITGKGISGSSVHQFEVKQDQ